VAVLRLVDRTAAMVSGLSANEVENIYSRNQSIVTLWAPAKGSNGAETFRHYVALDLPEFKTLRNVVTNLCREMGKSDGQNAVSRALRDAIELVSDDDLSRLSAGEIVSKRLGIPNLERTDLFSRGRTEIDAVARARSAPSTGPQSAKSPWDVWHERSCVAQTLLQAMEANFKIDERQIRCTLDKNTEKSSCTYPDRARTKFQWFTQVSDGAPVYYVPLDILP
jgi:hypothetical protein